MDDNEARALAVTQLKLDEGCRLHAYPDPLSGAQPYTIGWGHASLQIHPATVWTQAQADAQLEADVDAVCARLDSDLPWWKSLDPERGSILINMAYNMGVDGLLAFKNTLSAIKRGSYDIAAEGMLASRWAGQVPNRALRLATLMRTGARPAPRAPRTLADADDDIHSLL